MASGDGIVLILSGMDDPAASTVVDHLERRAVPTAWLDVGDFPSSLGVTGLLSGGTWHGRLTPNGAAPVDLAAVRAVYYGRPTRFRFPDGMSRADTAVAVTEARMGLGGVLGSLNARWVNDPARIACAERKPAGLRAAAQCGLAVPDTLVTNQLDAVREFAANAVGAVVCKPMASVPLQENGHTRLTYTTVIDPETVDAASFAVTTHLVQRWVPKAYDVRVTMIGQRPFAAAIHAHSAAARVDWRADYAALTYRTVGVPDEIAVGMVRYLDAFGLTFGAFDFAVTDDGEWVMFECNPAGGWLWIEHETGLPISAAFADLLAQEAR